MSEDGLVYTFPIREGVKFHDGTDLTAEDVKYSWDRAITMDLPGRERGDPQRQRAETTVVDDFTFEVTLKRRCARSSTRSSRAVPGRQPGRGRGQRRRRRRPAQRVHDHQHGGHRSPTNSRAGTGARTSAS